MNRITGDDFMELFIGGFVLAKIPGQTEIGSGSGNFTFSNRYRCTVFGRSSDGRFDISITGNIKTDGLHIEISGLRILSLIHISKEETVAQDHENRAMKEKIALDGSVQVDFEDRKKTKNELKQQLYYLLTVYAGKTLPWGTLTGIRPTKIPMELLEEGKSEDEIRSYMKEKMCIRDR